MRIIDQFIGNDIHDNLYNSLGHRSKEIDELNLHNYILFLGDNVSLGLEKEIQETYPYKVSKALKMDYYDLSIFNGGVDCFRYNLLTWIKRFQKTPPKFIVVGFEFLNAVVVSNYNYDYLDPADFNNEDVQDLYHHANLAGFFSGRNLINESIVLKNINIPIFQIVFEGKNYLFNSDVRNIYFNKSIYDYSQIAEDIIIEYKMTTSAVRP